LNLPFELTPQVGIVGLLAAIAMATAVGVVVFNNPVRSAICLVANFFTLAFIYFSLGAEMLGITQVIVYTGAIMVLFLFVIMLLNLSSDEAIEKGKFDFKPVLGVMLGFGLIGLIASQLLLPYLKVTQTIAPDRDAANPIGWGAPQAIGKTLFTGYVWPFEIVSILLMVGIVGAILLARRRVSE
jgi:NADH-quinone oxidoreductase subunit J